MADAAPDRAPTLLESALRSERATLAVLVLAVPVVCWAWIVVMARDMYGPMTGASRWMMTPTWDAPHLVLLWAMWAVMMIGMMLPSAAPAILHLRIGRATQARRGRCHPIYALAAGYVTVWVVFGLLATAVQRALGELLLLLADDGGDEPALGAALLVVAGVYQLTPFKRACLQACQSPLGFLLSRWRDGAGGAFRMGIDHGLYCLGCCWALMLLLFVGGVMNLAVIGALTALRGVREAGPVRTARRTDQRRAAAGRRRMDDNAA